MATPRKLSAYPSEFPDIFTRALAVQNYRGKKLLIPFPSYKEAFLFRQRLYAYRAALLQEPSLNPYLVLLAPLARMEVSLGNSLQISYPQIELNRIREALEATK